MVDNMKDLRLMIQPGMEPVIMSDGNAVCYTCKQGYGLKESTRPGYCVEHSGSIPLEYGK